MRSIRPPLIAALLAFTATTPAAFGNDVTVKRGRQVARTAKLEALLHQRDRKAVHPALLQGACDLDRTVPVGVGFQDRADAAAVSKTGQTIHVAPERIEIDLCPGGAEGSGSLQEVIRRAAGAARRPVWPAT